MSTTLYKIARHNASGVIKKTRHNASGVIKFRRHSTSVPTGITPFVPPSTFSASFGTQPAGTYTVTYISGAISYHTGFYSINDDSFGGVAVEGFNINYTVSDPDPLINGTPIRIQAPGSDSDTPYTSGADAQAANSGVSVTFDHGGGEISISFGAVGGYFAALDVGSPVFTLS